jgi:flagellar basal-body rod protein FlgF
MERGLYIAATGMVAEMVRQDQIANDLANASTPGYKADRSRQRSFGDILLANTVTGQTIGPLGLGAQIDRIVTDATPAPLRQTGEPLDFAIQGEGWFGVQTPQGVRYTRNGQFSVDAGGRLVNAQGHPVLSQDGAAIQVPRNGRLDPGRLGVFAVPNAAKEGENLFTGAAAGAATGRAEAGVLEGSGAEAARSMVDMIASFRAYEAGQRVIRTIDETLAKTAGQVGQIQ